RGAAVCGVSDAGRCTFGTRGAAVCGVSDAGRCTFGARGAAVCGVSDAGRCTFGARVDGAWGTGRCACSGLSPETVSGSSLIGMRCGAAGSPRPSGVAQRTQRPA
ncbi:hypothetical protein L6R52_34270, partial [Myxococcota bacterium]|nr:hypothetical protein [Myxococcota bacterium]